MDSIPPARFVSALSRRRVIGGSLLLLTASLPANSFPAKNFPSQKRASLLTFREEVLSILRVDYPAVTVTVDDDDLEQIIIGRFTLFLGNIRQKVTDLIGAERRAVIVNYLHPLATAKPLPATPAPAETFPKASVRLRIQLVPIEYREQVPTLTCRRFSERLLVAYALDEEKRYQLVTHSIFEGWGVDQATVERVARRNLELASGDIQVHVSATGKSGYFATLANESGYAAACLLLPMVMDQIQEGLGTQSIVAAVPTRDVLIAWSSNSEGKDRLASIVTMYMRKGPYGRSDELFSYSKDGIRPLNSHELTEHGR
ncbi:DUF1444 family protein [Methylobacterium marchantiae]|uniref:DUF1444 family protein n=1 Tax=Methylobacterium marchantiae TaxID=600331 RepID=A0ABW3WV27_9HYPH|nr:hypothetical protein AIGOOFII_3758 [Methylobacterium marchantiae]